MEPFSNVKPTIWCIGGGKGGVGKSFMACNLGVCLSRSGKKVLLVDADFGAANLHTFLGSNGGRFTFSDFLRGKLSDMQLLIEQTHIDNLHLISGAEDTLNMADISREELNGFYETLTKLSYDYILLDIGPGTSSNMLDLFLMADEGILVVLPEPTSVENFIRFLKCLFLYKMKKILVSKKGGELYDILKGLFSNKGATKVKTVADIFNQLKEVNSFQGQILKNVMGKTSISVIINQAKKQEDEEVGLLIKRACYDYFGFEFCYLGYIRYHDLVGESIRNRRPLTVQYKQSPTARAVVIITERLLKKKKIQAPQNANIANT